VSTDTQPLKARMTQQFRRTGDLKDLASYPVWLQEVVRDTHRDKMRVVDHELFALMREAKLPIAAMRRFLLAGWPTIEQFPRFMAMNLKKVSYGDGAGEDLARQYLIQNIRVEQKHAEHWVNWAEAAGVSLQDMQDANHLEALPVLAHWCWYVCDRESLAVAIAATNYAVEGVTGEWSCVVCSKTTYADSLPEEVRGPATRWLRVHAHYDDTHPCEALNIVATLLGHEPGEETIAKVRQAIQASYLYVAMGLDHSMIAAAHGSFDETASNASTLGALAAA
jgi:pyrroloquinoline quinone (PQQ) biosynthesis protein C